MTRLRDRPVPRIPYAEAGHLQRTAMWRAHAAKLKLTEIRTLNAVLMFTTSYSKRGDFVYLAQIAAAAYGVDFAADWHIKNTSAALRVLEAEGIIARRPARARTGYRDYWIEVLDEHVNKAAVRSASTPPSAGLFAETATACGSGDPAHARNDVPSGTSDRLGFDGPDAALDRGVGSTPFAGVSSTPETGVEPTPPTEKGTEKGREAVSIDSWAEWRAAAAELVRSVRGRKAASDEDFVDGVASAMQFERETVVRYALIESRRWGTSLRSFDVALRSIGPYWRLTQRQFLEVCRRKEERDYDSIDEAARSLGIRVPTSLDGERMDLMYILLEIVADHELRSALLADQTSHTIQRIARENPSLWAEAERRYLEKNHYPVTFMVPNPDDVGGLPVAV